MATTAWDRVTARLSEHTGYTPPREGADWLCPAHADSSPSLSVTRSDDKVLIYCHAGCSHDAVLDALNLADKDLFDTALTNGNGHRQEVAAYQYEDENGYLLFEVVRYEPKDFRQRVRDNTKPGGWRYSLGDTRRVIYRLPKIINAVQQGWPVWIAEGEKDVHALEQAGEVATCNPGGAGKWKPEYAQWFKGAHVFVVADKDAAGRRHARRVVESLEGKAAKVIVVEAVTGKDAADHLAHHNVDEFLRIRDDEVFAAEVAEKPEVLVPEVMPNRPFVAVPLDLSTKPEPRPTVGDYLYRGGLTVLQSEPGVGKTWVALWAAIQVMRNGGAVLYFDEEGGEDLARERLYALGADNALIDGRLHYFPFEARKWNADDLSALDHFIDTVGGHAIGVFDSLPDFLAAAGKSEDKAQDVTEFVNEVLGRLRRAGIAQLVLDHMRKPEQGKSKTERSRYSRGSGAKLAKADATVLLEVADAFDAEKSGKLRFWKTKDRYGRLPLPRLDEPGALLAVNVGNGRVAIEKIAAADKPEWRGPTECMDRITALLANPGTAELSQNQIKKVLPFGVETIDKGLARLLDDGSITVRTGPRNSLLYQLASQQNTLDMGDDPI